MQSGWRHAYVASNIPFAAAYALEAVLIMAVYLAIARKVKAFEAL